MTKEEIEMQKETIERRFAIAQNLLAIEMEKKKLELMENYNMQLGISSVSHIEADEDYIKKMAAVDLEEAEAKAKIVEEYNEKLRLIYEEEKKLKKDIAIDSLSDLDNKNNKIR